MAIFDPAIFDRNIFDTPPLLVGKKREEIPLPVHLRGFVCYAKGHLSTVPKETSLFNIEGDLGLNISLVKAEGDLITTTQTEFRLEGTLQHYVQDLDVMKVRGDLSYERQTTLVETKGKMGKTVKKSLSKLSKIKELMKKLRKI